MKLIIAIALFAICISCKSSHRPCDAYGMVDNDEKSTNI